jgi:leucyl aminopeptidase
MVEIKFTEKIFNKNVDYYVLPVYKNFNYSRYLMRENVNEILYLTRNEQINPVYCGKTMLNFENNGIKKFFFIGLGEPEKLTAEKIRQAAGFVIKELKTFNAKTILTVPWFDEKEKQIAQTEGLILASYDYQAPKKEKNERNVKCLWFYGFEKNVINPAINVCKNVFLLRDLMNMPSNIVTPTYIENRAKEIAAQHKLKINSFTKEHAKKIGMEAFYSVAKGSNEPAKFITLEYYGSKKSKNKIAFVGKE